MALSADVISACLVDDHLAVREGLPTLLAAEGISVVGATPAARRDVERMLAGGMPQVALVGAGGAGLEVARWLADHDARPPVLLLTDSPDDVHRAAVLETGAAGAVWKGAALDVCVRAIRTVARGQLWLDGAAPEPRGNGSALSPRERCVLQEIARGRSTEQAAEALGVSPHTVRTHLRNLQRKLGARTRAHAVALAIASRAIDPAR